MVLKWMESAASHWRWIATDAGEQLPRAAPLNGRRLLSVKQWADDASASTEYDTSPADYSAWQATGPPNVAPACGDIEEAWAPAATGTPQWLQVSFPTAAWGTSIEIYETNEAPFVTSVGVIDPGGVETTVFSGADTTTCGQALEISLAGNLLVKQVKVYTAGGGGWEEIDAVGLTGAFPSAEPSASPSAKPSTSPSAKPSTSPSAEPSTSPSAEPSAYPSAAPTIPSSSITTDWIVVLTVVCIVVVCGIIGALGWKLRSPQQHADQAVGAPTKPVLVQKPTRQTPNDGDKSEEPAEQQI